LSKFSEKMMKVYPSCASGLVFHIVKICLKEVYTYEIYALIGYVKYEVYEKSADRLTVG
jgi:hypothetical protein